MSNFTEEQIQEVWEKGFITKEYNKDKYRRGFGDALMCRTDYGDETSLYGWEIDHVYPEAEGGDDDMINLRPMQWNNNRTKSDDYPDYKTSINFDGEKNIKKDGNKTVNEALQAKLKKLYNI